MRSLGNRIALKAILTLREKSEEQMRMLWLFIDFEVKRWRERVWIDIDEV